MHLINKSTIILYVSLIVAGLAALVSCSGGGLTAGAGGSGIGGTGVTLVKGNIATVVAARDDPHAYPVRMFASISNLVSAPALAQSSGVGGIRVSGGGQSSVTDDQGRFELTNVSPSANFIISLLLVDSQQIEFSIGPVPQGAKVEVNNIVVNASQGVAKPASVEVEVDDGNSSGDGTSEDSGGSGGDDNDSTDEPDAPDDGDSADEPDEPEDGDSTDEPDEPDDGDSTDEPDEPEDNTSSDDKGN